MHDNEDHLDDDENNVADQSVGGDDAAALYDNVVDGDDYL